MIIHVSTIKRYKDQYQTNPNDIFSPVCLLNGISSLAT